MILAAGLGTRLRPLTLELPKPLVPIGREPALALAATRLAAAGFSRAVANTHHLPEAFTPERLSGLALAVDLIHEPSVLGTGGGVANARALLGPGDLVVWNGDIVVDLDVAALLAAHRSERVTATLAAAPRDDDRGTLGLDAEGAVVRLRGERFGEEIASADFLGVQVIDDDLRARLPIPGCLVADGYLPALRRGERIASFAVSGAWDDIGSLEAYLRANLRWLEARGLTSWCHPTARVASGVELRGCVIGEGAVVEGQGGLDDVVAWPGARLRAPLARAVVTPRALLGGSHLPRS